MIAWILFTGLLMFVIGWCIGVKAGGKYEYDRITEYYKKQLIEKGLEVDKYKTFKEKLADKMSESKN